MDSRVAPIEAQELVQEVSSPSADVSLHGAPPVSPQEVSLSVDASDQRALSPSAQETSSNPQSPTPVADPRLPSPTGHASLFRKLLNRIREVLVIIIICTTFGLLVNDLRVDPTRSRFATAAELWGLLFVVMFFLAKLFESSMTFCIRGTLYTLSFVLFLIGMSIMQLTSNVKDPEGVQPLDTTTEGQD